MREECAADGRVRRLPGARPGAWLVVAVRPGMLVMTTLAFSALVLFNHAGVAPALVQAVVTTRITTGLMFLWVRRTWHL